jgi:hypothetical protein
MTEKIQLRGDGTEQKPKANRYFRGNRDSEPVKGHRKFEFLEVPASLTAERAGPEQLLALSRAHWGIENCLHYVRDVSCREDQARAHAGHAPEVLAAFRNTALTLIRRLGYKVVEGFEHFAEHRLAAVEAVRGRRTE